MAVSVPDRNNDQVKATGPRPEKVCEHRENIDGGLTRGEHASQTGDAGRVHDLGISDKDYVAQPAQRVIRQDVRKAGGSPGLAQPEKFGGLLFPTEGS